MSIVTYSRLPQIDKSLGLVLSDNGYLDINNSPFLNQFVTVIKEAVKGPYNELYSIADNIDIGRARGQYLDRWGKFLNQPRDTISYASDLSLTNVELYLYGTDGFPLAADITNNAGDITIPSNTILSGSNSIYTVRTIDNVKISGDKNSVFVRVIAETAGNIYIPSGYLTNVSLSLRDISNIMPVATTRYQLRCRNNTEITGGTSVADDTTYSYMLQETAGSLGLSNERKLNTIYDIENVYDIKAVKYRGGICVFIDATNISEIEKVLLSAKNYIKNTMNFEPPVYCFPPIIRSMNVVIALTTKTKTSLSNNYDEFKTLFVEEIRKSKMGDTIQIQTIIDNIVAEYPELLSGSLTDAYLGGRQLLNSTIELMFNERVTITNDNITMVVS